MPVEATRGNEYHNPSIGSSTSGETYERTNKTQHHAVEKDTWLHC